MKYKLNLIFGLLLVMAACGGNAEHEDGRPTEDKLKADIQQIDDSLKIYYGAVMNGETDKIPPSSLQKAIDLHLAYYHYYPEGKYAAEYLDKVQQLYMQEKSYLKSAQVCDTLIAKFPAYKNRGEVLLSAASTYDYFLKDSEHAKKYYEMLLKTPKVSAETKENVKFRLQHLDLTLDEMAELQMKRIMEK